MSRAPLKITAILFSILLGACGSGGGSSDTTAGNPAGGGAPTAGNNTNNPGSAGTGGSAINPAGSTPIGTGNTPPPDNTGNPDTAAAPDVQTPVDSNPGAGTPSPTDTTQQTGGAPQAAPALRLVAGTIGGPGSLDGTGSAARFSSPAGMAVDAAGNVYIADSDNHTIRKVTPGGVVTTLAGLAGNFGDADGSGASARFRRPYGIAIDAAGNLYVADMVNQSVRRVTPEGVVTTIARGTTATANQPAESFEFPHGMAIDRAGNIYVADPGWGSSDIVKIAPDGVATKLASVFGVRAITVDAAGNVYAAASLPFRMSPGQNSMTSDRSSIKKITPDGTVTTLAGSDSMVGYADGPGTAARFNFPHGITVDAAGNLYVADGGNNRIRRVSPTGDTTTLAGGAECGSADGAFSSARFCAPYGIVMNAAGDLYVSEAGNATLRRLSRDGQVTTVAGLAPVYGTADGIGSAARFTIPYGITSDSAGALYVTDAFRMVRKVLPSGAVTTLAGSPNPAGRGDDGIGQSAGFSYARGISSDAQGNLYVADEFAHTIRKVTPEGVVTTFAGSYELFGSADGQGASARFVYPRSTAVDLAGNVYVADSANQTIRRITPEGMVTTLAGAPGMRGSADGTGSAARFYDPSGITVDGAGNVYVTDRSNQTIRRITPSGVVTTLAGQAGQVGSADGQGAAARFNYPYGIKADSAGNLYLADTFNNTIRRITPAGQVTTVAGVAGQRGIALGGLPGRLSWPYDVTVVGDRTLYVTSSNSVLQITLP